MRSVRSTHFASNEGGVESGEGAGAGGGAGHDGPIQGCGPSVEAQDVPERMREGEIAEATIGTSPGAEGDAPPLERDSR